MKKIEITHTFNKAYKGDDYDNYGYSIVLVTLDGSKIFHQGASESLTECLEDALFRRDLNDPADIIQLIKKLVEGNSDYEIKVTENMEDDE